MTHPPKHFKSGFVAIVGRPNVGKSTLMNAILGAKVAIATDKPQTTRNRILGVHTEPDNGQIVFVDTPGVHDARDRLNKRMVDAAWDAARQTDAIVFVVEAKSLAVEGRPPFWGGDASILTQLQALGDVPLILAVNKADQLPNREMLLPLLARVSEAASFAEVVVLSALKKRNVDTLVRVVMQTLPDGEPLYPEDMLTDRAERFLAAEYVREQVLKQLEREVPYSVAVEIEQFADDISDGKLHIRAVIHVERASQKAIVIGKGGSRIKEIGTAARHQLQQFFERPVHLETLVRVEGDWTQLDRSLDRFGYGQDTI